MQIFLTALDLWWKALNRSKCRGLFCFCFFSSLFFVQTFNEAPGVYEEHRQLIHLDKKTTTVSKHRGEDSTEMCDFGGCVGMTCLALAQLIHTLFTGCPAPRSYLRREGVWSRQDSAGHRKEMAHSGKAARIRIPLHREWGTWAEVVNNIYTCICVYYFVYCHLGKWELKVVLVVRKKQKLQKQGCAVCTRYSIITQSTEKCK